MAGSEGKISLSEGESTPRADAPQDEEEKREKVPEPRQSRVEETGEGGGEAVEGRAPAETSEKEKGQGQASSPAPEKFWAPERVQEVLKQAESFEDYKKKRVFRYLRLFSGPEDVLGRELKEEAKRNGMQVMVLALDKKKDKDLDLAKPESQELIQKEVIDGMWDGTHSGFPCGSFSRARHNQEGGTTASSECQEHLWISEQLSQGSRRSRPRNHDGCAQWLAT